MLTSQGRLARNRLVLLAAAVLGIGALGVAYVGFANRGFGAAGANSVAFEPGYVGESEFGDWELICAPAAATAVTPESFDSPDAIEGAGVAESACRVRFEAVAHDSTDQSEPVSEDVPESEASRVILNVSLSLVGPAKSPALMLRLPPTLKEDDPVTIRTRDDFALEIAARDCSEEECVAAGSLSEGEWERLVDAAGLQVVFPLDETQRVAVDVSTNGLRDALSALEATQSPSQ